MPNILPLLSVNNVTENVSKQAVNLASSKLDQDLGKNEIIRPKDDADQAEVAGGKSMTPEARRQHINLKQQRYQASSSRK